MDFLIATIITIPLIAAYCCLGWAVPKVNRMLNERDLDSGNE
jgi:hypothetical protein